MIPPHRVFDEFAGDYDCWFDDHDEIYHAQVRLLQNAVPQTGRGLELGVGSGRFAVPLGIRYGIDPSGKLIAMANTRGVEVVLGAGEYLPYRAGTFEYVLMMTVICFLEKPQMVLQETFRVLVNGGALILGFIEKDGKIATHSLQEKTRGRFLRFARFFSVDEVAGFLQITGFSHVSIMRRNRGFCVIKAFKL
jgi:ubiquinone/menaquinone biosynthesis C-methylase UbiE